jgi:hypothetical protein
LSALGADKNLNAQTRFLTRLDALRDAANALEIDRRHPAFSRLSAGAPSVATGPAAASPGQAAAGAWFQLKA